MSTEPLVIDVDPEPGKPLGVPVTVRLEVPPKAKSNGWGDMSWTKPRT